MDESAYEKVLALLDCAKLVLISNGETLSPADDRIRCLVNITKNEAQRALRDTGAEGRTRRANSGAPTSPVEEIPADARAVTRVASSP